MILANGRGSFIGCADLPSGSGHGPGSSTNNEAWPDSAKTMGMPGAPGCMRRCRTRRTFGQPEAVWCTHVRRGSRLYLDGVSRAPAGRGWVELVILLGGVVMMFSCRVTRALSWPGGGRRARKRTGREPGSSARDCGYRRRCDDDCRQPRGCGIIQPDNRTHTGACPEARRTTRLAPRSNGRARESRAQVGTRGEARRPSGLSDRGRHSEVRSPHAFLGWHGCQTCDLFS